MFRLLVAAIVGFVCAGPLTAQCRQFIPFDPPPIYISPSVFWGTPPPRPLPPAPFVPKGGAGVREEESKPPKSSDKSKPKSDESKKKELPRIPKTKLPLPDDPDVPANKPKSKKEPRADSGKAVEQFPIPAERNRSERPAEVKIGFFNHSDRDLILEVNGETLKLPHEQYVTLRLKRTFTWAEKGQKPTDVAVPPDADGMEIVFRK